MQIQTVGLVFFTSMLIITVLLTLRATLFIVTRETVAIIERSGAFARTALPGLNAKIPFFEQVAGIVSLRVRQWDVELDTQTEDGTIVRIAVSIQYHALPEKAFEAFCRPDGANSKLTDCVPSAIDTMISKMKLNDVSAGKRDIANILQKKLSRIMHGSGYRILRPSVTSLEAGGPTIMSAADISSAQRLQRVAAELNR
ncbi:MAG: hypothetical protein JXR76_06260 [Deltaproteobacteria bacterium]|nr:hypothetical protein [Deltaproteobacteria bacterium]